ncbi:MAG: GNAT family N-acetyltransferase [Pirellulales bacterium]
MSDLLTVVPPQRWSEAMDLLVSQLPAEIRTRQKATIGAALSSDPLLAAGLLGHFRDDALHTVCWLQGQPGRTANLWPPVQATPEEPAIAVALVTKALDVARSQDAALVQSLLPTDAGVEADTLRRAGFSHVADLLYLVSLAAQFPSSVPTTKLNLVPLVEADHRRLERIVERTYAGSCDCPALDGVRSIDDVLAGYRAAGRFRPELWFIARLHNEDVGCMLLADHAREPVWELIYMGVVPEARGRGLGLEMTRNAQWLAACERVERVVLAVDAANEPAIAMYAAAGFVSWDRRSVFVYVHASPQVISQAVL